MGLFDLPAPLFGAIDQVLGVALPAIVRIILWGVLAGWLTMVVYRKLSRQDRIQQLKSEQKKQQKIIAGFDGEFEALFPVIRYTLALGMRQLGLSLGPALLATIPILFLVIWVAGKFGYEQPVVGTAITIGVDPEQSTTEGLQWSVGTTVEETADGWILSWPSTERPATLSQDGSVLVKLPAEHNIPVIHKYHWWNWLMANPIGYLPDDAAVEAIDIALPAQQFLSFGPGWMRGWMFSFFLTFLFSSLGFKFALKID